MSKTNTNTCIIILTFKAWTYFTQIFVLDSFDNRKIPEQTSIEARQVALFFSFRCSPTMLKRDRKCQGEAGFIREEQDVCSNLSSIYYLNILYSIKIRTKPIYAQSVYIGSCIFGNCIHYWSSIKNKPLVLKYKILKLLQVSLQMDFFRNKLL